MDIPKAIYSNGTKVYTRSTIPVYRQFKSLGVMIHPDDPIIEFHFPALKLRAHTKDIIAKNWTVPFKGNGGGHLTGQLQYHYPLHLWEVIEGDSNWWRSIYTQYNWKLPKESHASTQHT